MFVCVLVQHRKAENERKIEKLLIEENVTSGSLQSCFLRYKDSFGVEGEEFACGVFLSDMLPTFLTAVPSCFFYILIV